MATADEDNVGPLLTVLLPVVFLLLVLPSFFSNGFVNSLFKSKWDALNLLLVVLGILIGLLAQFLQEKRVPGTQSSVPTEKRVPDAKASVPAEKRSSPWGPPPPPRRSHSSSSEPLPPPSPPKSSSSPPTPPPLPRWPLPRPGKKAEVYHPMANDHEASGSVPPLSPSSIMYQQLYYQKNTKKKRHYVPRLGITNAALKKRQHSVASELQKSSSDVNKKAQASITKTQARLRLERIRSLKAKLRKKQQGSL